MSKCKRTELDGTTIAIVLQSADRSSVLRGVGNCEQSDESGDVLRVRVDESESEVGAPEFVFQLDLWEEKFRVDNQFGCDFTVDLDLS